MDVVMGITVVFLKEHQWLAHFTFYQRRGGVLVSVSTFFHDLRSAKFVVTPNALLALTTT